MAACHACNLGMTGAPGEIRTPYPLVRSQVLYPDELRALKGQDYTHEIEKVQGDDGIDDEKIVRAVRNAGALSGVAKKGGQGG